MTKLDLAKRVGDKTGNSTLQASVVVQKTLDAILKSLIIEGRVELRGFGVFQVRKRAARSGRNPRTGESVFVPEKLVVHFIPAREMENRVRNISADGNARSDAA